MERLTRFQRVLLIALTALLAVFTVVYPVLSRRKGIQYRDALLLWSVQGENDVYAGRVDRARTVFTVAPDGTIQYRRGDTDYAPIPSPWTPPPSPGQRHGQCAHRGGGPRRSGYPLPGRLV